MESKFQKIVLGKYKVMYFQCTSCGSLQTETPYWLDEAYSETQTNLDTGAVRRTLYNAAPIVLISKLLKIKTWSDEGGGTGLLARILRDYNLNAQSSDKYVSPNFTSGITAFEQGRNEGLSCFEVLEHLHYPGQELPAWLHEYVRVAVISTELYTGQDEDWWYLSPENGQHVFFYSKEALNLIAENHDFQIEFFGIYVVLFRQLSVWKKYLLRILLGRIGVHILRIFLFAIPARGPERDLREILR